MATENSILHTQDLPPIWDNVTYNYTRRGQDSNIMKFRFDSATVGVDVKHDRDKGFTVTSRKSTKHNCHHGLSLTVPCYIPKSVSDYSLCEMLKDQVDVKLFEKLKERFRLSASHRKCKPFYDQFLKNPDQFKKNELPTFLRNHKFYLRQPPWENEDEPFGNCLRIVKGKTPMLFHVGGRRQNKIKLTMLDTQWNISTEAQNLKPKTVRTYKEGNSILSIASERVYSRVYLAATQSNHCHLLQVTSKMKTKTVDSVESFSKVTDATISPFIAGEYLYATDDKKITLRSNNSDVHVINLLGEELENLKSPWIGCRFRTHPRSVLAAHNYKILIYDLRKSCNRCLPAITIPSPLLYQEEIIHATADHPTNPFLFFATSTCSVLLFDERFPNNPVLKWNHMISKPPTLLSVIGSIKDRMHTILVGSKQSQDIAVMHLNSKEMTTNCSPVLLSRPQDIVDILSENGIYNTDKNLRRLSIPMKGIDGFTPLGDSKSVTVLQLTAANDIFAQRIGSLDKYSDAVVKTWRVGAGFQNEKLDENKKIEMQKWIDRCALNVDWVRKQKNHPPPKNFGNAEMFFKGLLLKRDDNRANQIEKMFDTRQFEELKFALGQGSGQQRYGGESNEEEWRNCGLEMIDVEKYDNVVSRKFTAEWISDNESESSESEADLTD